MENVIGKMLAFAVGGKIPFFFSEAEVEGYPYAMYTIDGENVMTKDGVHHINGDTVINVVSTTLDDALQNASMIKKDISDTVAHFDEKPGRGRQFSAVLVSQNEECVGGIWNVELNYKIKQYYEDGRI